MENEVQDPHRTPIEGDPLNEVSYQKYTQKEYAHDLIFEELLAFVEHNREKPFFALWTTPLPHVSLQAPKRWVDYYVKKFGDEEPYIGEKGYLPCRYPHATYAAMVSYFDEQVGKLIEKLKEMDLYEHTLIVFTSDNGPTFNGGADSPWFNSGGLFKSEYGWGKCFLHEGGIRVPAIFSWPGKIAPGSESALICGFQDIMPTLAELVSQPCPETDGISILPTLLGEDERQQKHEYLYWEYPEMDGQQAVRWGKWKGIITNIRKGNAIMQLFDLEKDVQELNDVAAEFPDVVNRLRTFMNEAHTEPENSRFQMIQSGGQS